MQQASCFSAEHLLLVFICVSPVTFSIPQVSQAEAQEQLWLGEEQDDELLIEGAALSGAVLEEKRNGWTPLTQAALFGREKAVRALIRLGADLERRGGQYRETALHLASTWGFEQVVRDLLVAGANVAALDLVRDTPLHCASYHEFLGIVKLLVAAGAEISPKNKYGETPLALAEKYHGTTVSQYLRSIGATK